MPPMENSQIGTLKETPIPQSNVSTCPRRRGPLRSRTVDTLLHILTLCYADSSNAMQGSDKGGTHIGSVTKDDVPLADANIVPNDSLCQGEVSVDETRMDLGIQEGGLYNKHVESTACDGDISGERKDLANIADTNPSNSFDIKDQDNYDIVLPTLGTGEETSIPMIPFSLTDMMTSSPLLLPTTKDVEEGEISGEFIDFMLDDDMVSVDKTLFEPEDVIGVEQGHVNENNLILSSAVTVEDVSKDMVAVVSTTKRNLVDYSEIAANGNSILAAKHGTASRESDSAMIHPEHLRPLQSILKNSAPKNQDIGSPVKDSGAQNSKKRQGSCTEENGTNKKVKKSVDATTCSENLRMLGGHSEDASEEIVDASAKKDAADEKKRKRVLTKERKAKKKRKERIKRAEENRKLGVKRLKIQTIVKEKKISYCRHYMQGRCHEGEKCKFSHDTIPLTKSKPCCHFSRHACMKGDDCPFDHQLSKYPCNNFLSKGFCSRGSDCMFSHEVQPSETSLNSSTEPKSQQKPSSLPDNSGSKKHDNVNGSCKKIDSKPCSVPMSVASTTKQNQVDLTPKLPARPPKGVSFRSQEKSPLETSSSPKVNAEIKDRGVQDSKEITKTPPVVPRGINFLSFGKKPSLDCSNSGFSFKTLLEGEGSKSGSSVNVCGDANVNNSKQMNSDMQTERPVSSEKPKPMIMLPFMSGTSQKALQSTLAFASKFEFGVKSRNPEK